MFNFGVVDSLDTVPAEFKAVYGSQPNAEGKFEVKPEFKQMVAAYTGQATALTQERAKIANLNKENADRRAATKAYEDLITELGVTPEDPNDIAGAIRAHVTQLQDKVKGGEAFRGNLAKIQEAANKKIAEITTQKDAELKAMQSTLEEHLIDNSALTELAAAKAKGGGRMLIPHVRQRLKVVKDQNGKYGVVAVDEAGQAVYNAAGQPASVKDVIQTFKQTPEYGFAFESDAAGGTGHIPNSGRTPNLSPANKGGELSSVGKISAGLATLTGGRSS